jgi:probable HAF family extracellular repeat protein
MRLRIRFAIPCIAVIVGSPLPARAEPLYTMTFLPEWFNASAINDAGQMTGVMRVPCGSHAFLYTNGDVRDLGALGGTRSFGHAISGNGMVTGEVAPGAGPAHAFLYANGTMRDLGTLPGGSSSIGLGINDDGQVAGSSTTRTDQTHAVLADSGGMRDLGTLGGNFSYGAGINNAGHVVGASTTQRSDDSPRHAFFYHDGMMADLGDMGGTGSFADGINNRDQIIGAVVDAAQVAHPFIDTDGVVTMLGDFGGRYTGTWDINNLGQVVGYSTFNDDIGSRHGFLYTDGKMFDINALIDPALGWTVATAIGINDARQILGYACRTSDLCRPVRLDPIAAPPVPEPGSLAMLLAGLATGGLWRKKKNRRTGPAPGASEREPDHPGWRRTGRLPEAAAGPRPGRD